MAQGRWSLIHVWAEREHPDPMGPHSGTHRKALGSLPHRLRGRRFSGAPRISKDSGATSRLPHHADVHLIGLEESMTQDKNFLTFDIEEWYHVNYQGIDTTSYQGSATNLESLVDRLIDICGEHGVRTTCFVLGTVGKQTPSVVKKLHAHGHEIASHGSAHESVYAMTPDQFRADLQRS